MNTAVTAAVPEKFYCQSSRTCHPSWAMPGHAYKKDSEIHSWVEPEDEGSDDRVGSFPVPQRVLVPTEKMCKVVDCDFLPLKNVGPQKHCFVFAIETYFLCLFPKSLTNSSN